MNLPARIKAFSALGLHLQGLTPAERALIMEGTVRENPWFTPSYISMAVTGIIKFLREPVLIHWTSAYALEPSHSKTIGVVMAGNIPLAGFHDFLCVLISGHRLKAKRSSQDSFLPTYLGEQLIRIEPRFRDLIQWAERLHHIDAVIATGSDNTARYFDYYFKSIPRIIRKNRSSVAVLSGKETMKALHDLGNDVFSYFGLGCRNVSKLYVPSGFDFVPLFQAWEKFSAVAMHHKYANNYDYHKSILLVNRDSFLDNGFILLREDPAFVSPISVVYYEYYMDLNDLQSKIRGHLAKIQCIVSMNQWFAGSEEFGQAQFPEVTEYADNADTLKFLSEN